MTSGGIDASAAVATHDVALARAEEASPRAREVRALLGFRDGRNSALLARTLMLAELRALLGAVAPGGIAPGVVAPSSASAGTIAPAICWETYASEAQEPDRDAVYIGPRQNAVAPELGRREAALVPQEPWTIQVTSNPGSQSTAPGRRFGPRAADEHRAARGG